MDLRSVTLDDLAIDDEASFARVELYGSLKRALRRSGHRFLIPAVGGQVSWDRALFLNLTYWGGQPEGDEGAAGEGGADVLCDGHIAADEVGHVAWHHVVGRALAGQGGEAGDASEAGEGGDARPPGPPSPEALFFSESIASAFDLYLVGRLLRDAPDSDFITTQVPLISDRAQDAGLSTEALATLLAEIERDPERAFEDMRALLLDVANALLACRGPRAAQRALDGFVGRRFEPLLHHFEISNWILYARAYGARSPGPDAILVRRLDATLRQAPTALGWLAAHWVDTATA